MKKIILLLVIANYAISQNINYSVSEDFMDIKSKFDFGIFKFNDNLFGNVYYLKGDCFKIQTFDRNFNKVTEELTVALPDECKEAKNALFRQYKDNFYCFYTTLKNKVGTLYALKFDVKNLKFNTEAIKLYEVEDIQKGAFYGEFGYESNSDSSLILVQYVKEYISKGDFKNNFITMGYVIFDNKLNKKYATEIQFPYTIGDATYSPTCSLFGKNGNIFILTPVKVNNSIDGMGITKDNSLNRLELLSLNKKNNVWEKKRIELDDNKYIRGGVITEDLNGKPYILGRYTNVNPDNKTLLGSYPTPSSDGVFTMQIGFNPNGSVLKLQSNLIEFPDNVIKMYEDNYKLKSMNKEGNLEIEGLSIENFILNKDSSLLFICEEVNSYSVQHDGQTINSSVFEDITLLKIDKNKKFLWCHKIPKSQVGFFGYHYLHSKNDDYIFYLDDTKNLNLSPEQKAFGYKIGDNASFFCVKIDEKGILTQSSLFETKQFKGKTFISMHEKINENSFIFKSKDKGTSKIFKIDIK